MDSRLERLRTLIVGPQVVMTTPFKEDYSVDLDGVRAQIRFMVEKGFVRGNATIIVTGSVGECNVLTESERQQIVKVAAEEAQGRATLFAGCNHSSTSVSVELAKWAQQVGCDGVMVIPPYYWRPTDDEVIQHYSKISEAINIGIMIYNNPFVTQVDLPIPMIERLAKLENVVALKECTIDIIKFDRCVRRFGDRIAVINGNGEYFEPYASMVGTPGFISNSAPYLPEVEFAMWDAIKAKDWERAKQLHIAMSPLFDFFWEVGAVGGTAWLLQLIKRGLQMAGLPVTTLCRMPATPVTEEYKRRFEHLVEEVRARAAAIK
ncbi:MAG: dihydrodipicolinate synthase family protein [Firmicutes bacterium]|nr:dihydrodipicolinate synthase family protein [Bacillota bacterium]